jgi:hypothetical protein
MKQRIESFIWFAIENGPTIFTIAFAIYVIALAQTIALPTETLLQWILAILGLLAISELVERLRTIRRIERVSAEALELLLKRENKPSADKYFMWYLPPLDSYLDKANDISLSGLVVQHATTENLRVLAKRLKDGARIRILATDPSGESVKHRSGFSLENLKANAQVTLQNIIWLSQRPERKGSIEFRYIDELPHFNITIIDPEQERGVIFVEFYLQRWVTKGRPRIELTAERDGEWFAFFKNQFEILWQESKPVSLSETYNAEIKGA